MVTSGLAAVLVAVVAAFAGGLSGQPKPLSHFGLTDCSSLTYSAAEVLIDMRNTLRESMDTKSCNDYISQAAMAYENGNPDICPEMDADCVSGIAQVGRRLHLKATHHLCFIMCSCIAEHRSSMCKPKACCLITTPMLISASNKCLPRKIGAIG